MSKITKKSLQMGWDSHDTEIIKIRKELRELRQDVLRLEKPTDGKLLDKPKLKVLDQSVFDGEDERFSYAAVESNGRAYLFEPKAEFASKSMGWDGFSLYKLIGDGYDTTNWQDSLIERESKELTGSDLCRAMLERGDKWVLCFVHEFSDDKAVLHEASAAIRGVSHRGFETDSNEWECAVPINNQGEPLTAKEVGL